MILWPALLFGLKHHTCREHSYLNGAFDYGGTKSTPNSTLAVSAKDGLTGMDTATNARLHERTY